MHKIGKMMSFSFRRYIWLMYFFATLLFPIPSMAKESTYTKVEIFYVSWDIVTRSRLSPDDVRKRPYISTIIVDDNEISSFVRWLKLGDMTTSNSASVEDARLVIDLIDERGNRTTYYAGRFQLLSADGLMTRTIDEHFRAKFTFFAK